MAATASWWFVAIYFIEAAVMIWRLHLGALYNADTFSYLSFNPVMRPPVYPALIRMWLFAAGPSHYLVWLSITQAAIFACSIPLLASLAFRGGKWCGLIVTAVYACYMPFVSWSLTASSEGLAISFAVIAFHAAVGVIDRRDHTALRLLWLIVMMTLLSLLRPAFMYFTLALALVGCVMLLLRGRRRRALSVLVAALWSAAIYLGYASFVEARTGVFTPSVVGLHNNFYTQRMYGRLVPDAAADPGLRDMVRSMVERRADFRHERQVDEIWCEGADLFDTYRISDISRMLDAADGWQSVGDRMTNWRKSFGEPLISPGFNEGDQRISFQYHPAMLLKRVGLTLGLLYLSLAVTLIGGAVWSIRRRRINFAWWLAWLLTAGNVGAIVAGFCPIDYARLMLPSMPMWFLLMGWSASAAWRCLSGRRRR